MKLFVYMQAADNYVSYLLTISNDSNPESLESLTATKFMSCAELWSLDSFPRPLILSALPFSSFVQKLIRDYFPRINVIRGQEN